MFVNIARLVRVRITKHRISEMITAEEARNLVEQSKQEKREEFEKTFNNRLKLFTELIESDIFLACSQQKTSCRSTSFEFYDVVEFLAKDLRQKKFIVDIRYVCNDKYSMLIYWENDIKPKKWWKSLFFTKNEI